MPAAKTMTQMTRTARAILRPKMDSRLWRGVFTSSSSCSMVAILPSSVLIPVATTIPEPLPAETVVPL